MESKELKFTLEKLDFSADMPEPVLDRLAEAASIHHVAAGTCLFREGEANNFLRLVCEGSVALEMSVPGRGAVRILTVGPGEMVGWSSLLNQGKMTAAAVAVDDSRLVVAPADALRRLCESNHEFGYHLMQQMADALSKRLLATRLQLLDLFADSPPPIPAGGRQEEG